MMTCIVEKKLGARRTKINVRLNSTSSAKGNIKTSQIDFFLAGDLLNQTVTANYVARKWGIPF